MTISTLYINHNYVVSQPTYNINSGRVPSILTETNEVLKTIKVVLQKTRKPTITKVLEDMVDSNTCSQLELASYCRINNSQNQNNINKFFEKRVRKYFCIDNMILTRN